MESIKEYKPNLLRAFADESGNSFRIRLTSFFNISIVLLVRVSEVCEGRSTQRRARVCRYIGSPLHVPHAPGQRSYIVATNCFMVDYLQYERFVITFSLEDQI
ncbi:hypothetical protein SAMN05660653_01081 [Desulfonatronum thiosulfatophilum]|uniref:Uncharacterized protein n=1 Tax=Desulfonatronum thiosulfatophilum TaxID=617002 RepID=A0A1G6BP09_9BACT|nr:hypothetical protein [Desulfonatronum thiosulfatophilum]SDB22307.1 hypothetical protein SAMN05660653_01081 [Desulfonatronum thiosulfatophilum]